MTDNFIIRPPEGVADNCQYPNQEAWLITPLSGNTTRVWRVVYYSAPTTPNTQTWRHARQLHYPGIRRSARQLSISKPGGIADNSTIRLPEGVADNSQYPNKMACPATPLSDHQKEWPITPNTRARRYSRELQPLETPSSQKTTRVWRVVYYAATRRSSRQLSIPKPGDIVDNSSTRPPEEVAENSLYLELSVVSRLQESGRVVYYPTTRKRDW